MLDPDEQAELDRRVLLRTGGVAAAAGAVALAAGGLTAWLGRHSAAASTAETSGGATSGSAPDPSPSPSTSPSAAQTPAASASGAASAPPPGTAVGRASAVPVGRALRTRDPRTKQPVWVVHTRKGFKAFSAVCTHAGCTVDFQRSSTQFACPCHGARYDATNGHVLAGPAPDPLPPLRVEVVDGEIRLL
jgi:thiosulfate dehydrogenase [quinone] large subunit